MTVRAPLHIISRAFRRGVEATGELVVSHVAEALGMSRGSSPWEQRLAHLLASVDLGVEVELLAEDPDAGGDLGVEVELLAEDPDAGGDLGVEVNESPSWAEAMFGRGNPPAPVPSGDSDVAWDETDAEGFDDMRGVDTSGERTHQKCTTHPKHITKIDLAVGRLLDPQPHPRPRLRGECMTLERPCPFIACRHHLAYEVQSSGSLTQIWPRREVWDLPTTCSLDVAELGGQTLDEVAEILNVTRERVRQIQVAAFAKLKRGGRGLRVYLETVDA